ncbi:MAG: CDP-4-dehydro-6-deoxy-D-gulose 4-reductase [Candidatus Sericytochromatia bacterium]|nr:MAG: CDP-4-dehydro-6-deoxy-D-gulose 4-reductase [Candidatus Sericytochromatia bacterium]
MKKLLLTGASGFIGKNLIKYLDNYKVIAIVNKNKIEEKTNLYQIKLDLNNFLLLENLIKEEKPEILIHLAWITDNKTYLNSQGNLKWLSISKKLIDLFIKNNGKKLLVAGSCAEDYFKETLYSKTKANLKDYCFSKNIDITWLKIFFPFGPGDKKEKLIPSIINSGLKNKDFYLKEPENIIDYIYIDDLVFIIYKVLKENKLGTVEIGTGKGYKLIDIANKIYNLIGSNAKINYNKRHKDRKIIVSKPVYYIENNIDDKLENTIKYHICYNNY